MSLAKVWNDNVHPYKQIFKGEKIEIPPKSFIEMEYAEAHEFKSSSPTVPMSFDGMGNQMPESYKMIRVEGKPPSSEHVVAFKCHLDGSLHASKKDLDAYIAKFDDSKFADEDAVKAAKRKA